MKKLISFIRPKEREDLSLQATDKKTISKDLKPSIDSSTEDESSNPKELFWDDYSDIGYC